MVVTGIIRPPPEIRVVADRTALYVAKNGRAFEQKILNSEKGRTPRFAFLQPPSPFHAYYQDKIQFYENGGTDKNEKEADEDAAAADKKKKAEEDAAAQQKQQKATSAMIDPIAKALLTQRTKIRELRAAQEEAAAAAAKNDSGGDDEAKPPTSTPPTSIPAPPKLPLLDMVAPASLSTVQLEILQTVAQFVALSGHVNATSRQNNVQLLQQLRQREWNNPALSFIQPRHGHFAYFSALVDAYQAVLQQQQDSDDPLVTPLAGNVPACLEAAAYRAEYQRDQEARRRDDNDDHGTVAAIDWHDFVVVETIDFAVDEQVVELPPPPPPPVVVPKTVAPQKTAAANDENGMDVSDNESDEEETIRVVPSYTPKVVASGAAHTMETVIDPITGKSVAVRDMPEHLRIQLLDPKWAEERKKFQDKQKESNLVSGDVVASNLERFAQARGDRFGKKEQDLLSQEAESKKRLDEANRIIREQGRSVGPTLPRKEPPTKAGEVEPTAKRPKITYAPAVLAAQQQPPPPPLADGSAAVLPPPPPPPTVPPVAEDPFAAAATGALPPPPPPATQPQELLSEADFAAANPQVTLQIRVPNDPSQMAWNFYGQIVSVSITSMSSIKQVKVELSGAHLNGMPANKMQLRNPATGTFLKDAATLASLNLGVGPTTTLGATVLELSTKLRGGKKK